MARKEQRARPRRLTPYGVCSSTGKSKWETRDGARQQLRSLKAHGKAGEARRLNTYRCPRCGHWHVGHRPAEGE